MHGQVHEQHITWNVDSTRNPQDTLTNLYTPTTATPHRLFHILPVVRPFSMFAYLLILRLTSMKNLSQLVTLHTLQNGKKTPMQEACTKASTAANMNKQCGKKQYDS